MLWYLLYPIRGTTQPPRLSANHPIRRAFYRHGKTTAQHWLVAMLVTVAIAMAFSYPTILLSENPTAGLASYPHHVWTTARPHDDNPGQADVEMRQVWIHGSYMRALEKDVLKRALDIQQTLLGEDSWTSMFPSLRSSTLSWGYHSPLMYWNNSLQIIDADQDILQTINRQARTTSSSLNVALRPASVFAGKKFDHRKLTAADALVITLMNKVEGSVGNRWQDRMASLTTGTCQNCILFPRDGHVTRNRVYEFSFTPLSAQENIALSFAYGLMALYVLLSLRRLRAFHSRFGLVVTAITQMTCSILASFTICGILKINLSMIPQNAYPFVVLVMGAENMFRIINAVELYPPTMATDLRIANALGDVGPVSVATAVQNFIILSLLGRLVSPGVAAFCAFACIATLFDAFFLMTFFVAVLMVDIRRFELQDALARANQSKHKRKPSPVHHHTWFDALVHGRLPFSTRMAGTAVSATFILSLNYHFFEQREQATSLRHLLRLVKNGPPQMTDFDTFAPLPINATLTPGQWMRMQDFDTAREVMRLAKPGADSFIIRIFAPLIVVLSGADRNGVSQEEWTTALRSFAMHHFYPVAVAVVFAVTFVSVLMNFLLYTEHEDEHKIDLDSEDEQAISLRTVSLPHRLDIVKLSGTEKSHLLTVALDRTIAISLYDRTQQTHRVLCLTNDILSQISWPIHSIALEENGEIAALHCGDDRVLIYSVVARSIILDSTPYPDDNPPLLFEFRRLPSADANKLHFIILTSGGRLTMIDLDNGKSKAERLTDVSLLGAKTIELSNQVRRLMVVTEQTDIICFSWSGSSWIETIRQSLSISTLLPGPAQIERYSDSKSDVFVVTTRKEVLFLDTSSLDILGKLEIEAGEPSISNILLGQVLSCPACGQLAFRCAALVGQVSSDCVFTIMWPRGEDTAICVRTNTVACPSFDKAQKTTHRLSKQGAWNAVASQAVLGLRKSQPKVNHSLGESTTSRLKRRQNTRFRIRESNSEEGWQAYKLCLDGELDTNDMPTNDVDSDLNMALYVNEAGPAVTLDSQSIAVAFGNTVKLIRSVRRDSPKAWVRRPTGRSLARVSGTSKEALKQQVSN